MPKCSTDHICGENQTLETFNEVMTTRLVAFTDWVKEHPLASAMTADESDWDDAYRWWMYHIELPMSPASTTFEQYLKESEA